MNGLHVRAQINNANLFAIIVDMGEQLGVITPEQDVLCLDIGIRNSTAIPVFR